MNSLRDSGRSLECLLSVSYPIWSTFVAPFFSTLQLAFYLTFCTPDWFFILDAVMSADSDEQDIIGAIFKGAAFYLVKPITINNIQNLWQFAFMKRVDPDVGTSGYSQDEYVEEGDFVQSEIEQNCRNAKRKALNEGYFIEEDENDDSSVQKRTKLIWSPELHERFVQAVSVIGINGKIIC